MRAQAYENEKGKTLCFFLHRFPYLLNHTLQVQLSIASSSPNDGGDGSNKSWLNDEIRLSPSSLFMDANVSLTCQRLVTHPPTDEPIITSSGCDCDCSGSLESTLPFSEDINGSIANLTSTKECEQNSLAPIPLLDRRVPQALPA